jgi:MFS family permease
MSSNQRWVLGMTAAASLMVVLDALVVSTALSTIRLDLHASVAQLEWTVNGYALSFAVLLMTAAVLGDRFGRRLILGVGVGVFVAASAGCALSPSVGWLIACRVIQGAGALVMPVALALLGATFSGDSRPRALGVFAGASGLAVPLGPLLGRASGAFSTLRQLGGAFGVAVLVAVFAGAGGYGSPQAFSDGFVAAIAACAGLALAAALAGSALPGRRPAPALATAEPAPSPAPPSSPLNGMPLISHTQHNRNPYD